MRVPWDPANTLGSELRRYSGEHKPANQVEWTGQRVAFADAVRAQERRLLVHHVVDPQHEARVLEDPFVLELVAAADVAVVHVRDSVPVDIRPTVEAGHVLDVARIPVSREGSNSIFERAQPLPSRVDVLVGVLEETDVTADRAVRIRLRVLVL